MTGLFDGTFARGGAAAAVSDAVWFRALLATEAALGRAAASVGLVPTTAADAVTAACGDPAGLDLPTVVARAADAGNPVPPLVRVLQDAVGERDAVAEEEVVHQPAARDLDSVRACHHIGDPGKGGVVALYASAACAGR